jgi:hypothetical protein
MTYFIAYDLNDPGQDYSELYQEIKSLADDWIHPLESIWFIDSLYSAKHIRDQLKDILDESDKMLVMRASGTWATNFKNADTEWLKEYT